MEQFGDFIKKKRGNLDCSLRQFAKLLEITPSYLSDIERNRRHAPSKKTLDRMLDKLEISDKNDKEKFYDLAKKGKPVPIAEDVQEYLSQNESIVKLCRTIRDAGKDPNDIIKKLKEGDL